MMILDGFFKSTKRVIKWNPFIYRMSSKLYQYLHNKKQFCVELMFDAKAKHWRNRGVDSAAVYWESRHDEIRNNFLCSTLVKFNPTSIFEVGCNCGNKLYPLAKMFPQAKLTGTDINSKAVEYGSKMFAEEGISNVDLIVGRAEDLNQFPDSSFDIVFSWATLIYITPSHIQKVLSEMFRISKKGVVLLEMQESVDNISEQLGVYCGGNWKRDYVAIFQEFSQPLECHEVKWIPKQIWQPGGGGGAVVEIIKL
jgi:ubiquinone/menaquinone biosynthesis C-methylase UbiE